MPQYDRAPELPFFSSTFDDVNAGAQAPAIGAAAFAQGNDVAFGSTPQLNPAAHEAAHVVQQARGRVFAGQY